MLPLVSILVPVFGVEKFIEKCARSLFEQSYDNIEFIFVNDCTRDDSIKVLQSVIEDYPIRKKNIKIINHESNKGLSGARNTGVDNAIGEYITFVDSDDYLEPFVIEKLIRKALDEQTDIVVFNMRYVYPDRCIEYNSSVSNNPFEYTCQLLTYKNSVCVCGKLFRRLLFVENGIRFIEGLNFGEDYVTSPRISYYAKSISHCPDIYYDYVQYNTLSYSNNYKPKNIDDLIMAVDLLYNFFNDKGDFLKYQESLGVASLINKTKLISAICTHYREVGYKLEDVCDLYLDRQKYSNLLPWSYSIILWLSNHKFVTFLRLYINIGLCIKKSISRLNNSK